MSPGAQITQDESFDTAPGLKPHGFSGLRGSLRSLSRKGLPGPCAVARGGVIARQTGWAVRAGVWGGERAPSIPPRHRQNTSGWCAAGGTATTERLAPAALALRMRRNPDQPASAIDWARG